jgi:hypothetical protein
MTNGPEEPGAPVEPEASDDRWRRIAFAIGALLVVLAIVVVVLLLSDKGDGDNTKAAATSTSTTVTTTPTTTQAPTTNSGGTGTGSGGTTATTAPPTSPSNAPVITSYTSSTTSIACPASDVSTTLPPPTVTLSWATQNATGVDLSVDGPGVYGSNGPSGSTTLNVACNGATHTYLLTAKGSNGQTATKTISVATHT